MSYGPVSLERHGDIAVITVDNPPVNALSQAVRQGLLDAFADAGNADDIRGVVLACAGRTFIAGADIKEFGRGPLEPLLPDVIAAMEAVAKPTVAAIHGTALGGGLEVALGCHYRVMSCDAEVGLPEVKLGIIPGAGGTQRLPRLCGVETALDIATSGRRVDAEEAVSSGIADGIADDDLLENAIRFAGEKIVARTRAEPVSARPVPPVDPERIADRTKAIAKRARGQLSPVKAAESVVNAVSMPFADGMAREREIFSELVGSGQSKALRYAFFAERGVSKIPGLEDVAAKPVDAIGVVGAGTMGSGIAVACADAGFKVIVSEMSEAAAEAGRSRIDGIYGAQEKRGRLSPQERAARQGRISVVEGLEALSDADLIIEAVFEDITAKTDLLRRLSLVAGADSIIATNTSYLDVNEIAAAATYPERVCGMHFFSPANVMKLLEVVRGARTSDETLQTALAVGRKLKKVSVVAGVCDGFIGNRIWATWRKQAEFLIEEGAYPEDVDTAITDFGFPMGPFAVYDLSGLDIAWAQRKRRAADRDPQSRYVTLPDTICEMGRFGRKTGAGWYDYTDGRAAPDPVVRDLIDRHREENGFAVGEVAAEEIQARMRATMVNEGARILDEKIALRPADIDMVMIHGYGYPAWRGGPMFEADAIGLRDILADVEAVCAAGGYGWEPAPLLKQLAEEGRTFSDWAKDG